MCRGAVDALHEALEEPLVERLDEAVQGVAELRRGARHLTYVNDRLLHLVLKPCTSWHIHVIYII